ncbi:hypothetical protein ABFS83_07G021400 [Erythranthe nasuta]
MEEGKAIEAAIAAEIQLPEAMIQRIQSLLSRKQAAQTTLLSKSWYMAWSTRPNLALDTRDFRSPHDFSAFAARTMERYEKSDLTIVNFRLYLDIRNREYKSLACQLIFEALKIGVLNLIVEFRVADSVSPAAAAAAVVESRVETVVRWSVTGREIGRGKKCLRHKPLKSIGELVMDDIFGNMIPVMPPVENLWSYECGCLAQLKKTTIFRDVVA